MSVMSNIRDNTFSSVGTSSSALLNVLAMNQFTDGEMQEIGMDTDVYEPSVSTEQFDEKASLPLAEENPRRPRRRLRKLQEDSSTTHPADSLASLKNKRDEYNDFFKPVVNLLHVPLNYSSVSKDCPALRLKEIEDYNQKLPDNVIFKRPLTPEPKRRSSPDEVVGTTNDASSSLLNLPPNFLTAFLEGTQSVPNWNFLNLLPDPSQLLPTYTAPSPILPPSPILNSVAPGYQYFSPSTNTNSLPNSSEETNNIFYPQTSLSTSTECPIPALPTASSSFPNASDASSSTFSTNPTLRFLQSLPNLPLNTQKYLLNLNSLLNGTNIPQQACDMTAFGNALFPQNFLPATNMAANIAPLSQFNNFRPAAQLPKPSPVIPARKKSVKLSADNPNTAAYFQKQLLAKNNPNDEATQRYQTMLRIKQANNEKIYTCSYCLLFFQDEPMYKMHAALHHPLNAWTCSLCGMECNNRLFFNVHIIATKHEQAKPPE